MPYPILGLHHVTATADDAQDDLDFCLGALGLRLVKKTVNFDNHHVYHFYYGTEHGAPGTIWTTFPYKGHGVRRGSHGAGQIVATSFSVPPGSLDPWRERLASWKVAAHAIESRFGEAGLRVEDPSGLVFELLGADDARAPWSGGPVPAAHAIRGLHGVTAVVRSAGPTIDFLSGLLGFRVAGRDGARTRLSVGGDGPGHYIDVVEDPTARPGVNGLGTVHHVAVAIATAEAQRAIREEIVRLDVPVTEVRDRCYFQSIYFREPGGVLIEVATVAPGFAVDEVPESLGRALKLPPWEEAYRGEIEAGLPVIVY